MVIPPYFIILQEKIPQSGILPACGGRFSGILLLHLRAHPARRAFYDTGNPKEFPVS